MSAASNRKAYGAFLGSLTFAICLGAYLVYSKVPGSEFRVWVGLSVLSIGLQILITGQQGFETRDDSSQNEEYFYCGAIFEENEDQTPAIWNPVFSQAMMTWRIGGLAMILMTYFFCLRHLSGFSLHGSDIVFLLGLSAFIFASTLRHFLSGVALNVFLVLVHETYPVSDWVVLGVYVFLLILMLQFHRLLDLEVNAPGAQLLRRPKKQTEIALSSLGWTVFAALLVVISNAIIPQSKTPKIPPKEPKRVTLNPSTSNAMGSGGSEKVSINRDDAMKVLQKLQESGGKGQEMSLPSRLELEGMIRKDIDSHVISENQNKEGDDKVELSKETLALMDQALKKGTGENVETGSELRSALEKARAAQPSSQNAQAQGDFESSKVKQQEIKKDWTREIEIAEKLLFIAALLTVFAFISKLLRKNVRPEDVQAEIVELSADEKARLRKEWKELRKRAGSGRDEVVACYHFFLKLMSALGHGRPESLPPHEYISGLGPFFPLQIRDIRGITDVFCDVFYGRQELENNSLKAFRAQFDGLCRHLI